MTGFSGRRAALTTTPIFFYFAAVHTFCSPTFLSKMSVFISVCYCDFPRELWVPKLQNCSRMLRWQQWPFLTHSVLKVELCELLSIVKKIPGRTIWMRRDFLWFVVSVGLTSVTGSYTGHHCDGNMRRFSSHGRQEAKNEIQGGAKARKKPQGLVSRDLFLHLSPSYLFLSSHKATVLWICQEINHWWGRVLSFCLWKHHHWHL